MRASITGLIACAVLGAAVPVFGQSGQTTLRAVLETYEAEGYRFVWSARIVQPERVVPAPEAPTHGNLETLLRSLGLRLQRAGAGHTYAIIRRPDDEATDEAPPKSLSPPIRLDPESMGIEEIVVSSSRYRLRDETHPSHRMLTSDFLTAVPSLGDDALRPVTQLPGAATVGLSSKPHVRGGYSDELLVVFNDVELLEPYHLQDFQNVFSGLNPSTVGTVDVYTGAFPVRFGNRMSGVLDVTSAEALEELRGELGLSFFSTWATGAGVTAAGDGRWLASARRGNLDIITKEVNSRAGTPRYSDYYGQFSRQLNADSYVDMGLLVYYGDITFASIEEESGERSTSEYDNVYGWTQYHRQYSPDLYGRTGVSVGYIDRTRESVVRGEDPDESVGFLDDDQNILVAELDHVLELDRGGDSRWELGVGLGYQRADYDVVSEVERGDIANLVGAVDDQLIDIDTRPAGLTTHLYGSWRWQVSERWLLEAGLRWDGQDYGDGFEQQLSPRVSVRFDFADAHAVRLSAGRFYQPEAIHELQAADGIDRFQEAQYADHAVIGYEGVLGDVFGIRLEAYYKRVDDPKVRFENLFNAFVIAPEMMPDRVSVAASRAEGLGTELSFTFEPSPDVNAWLNVARASVKDRIDGRWEPRAWNQDATANAGVWWRRGNWELSAAVTWHSGWQTTTLPAEVDDLDTPLDLDRNGAELDHFFTLDLKVQRTWKWRTQSLDLYFELINATDRDNVGGVEYEIEEFEDAPGYEIVPEEQQMLPMVPSIGVVWRFN